MKHLCRLVAALPMALFGAPASALTFEFDYRFDRGFFTAADGSALLERRAALDTAAVPFMGFLDSLDAIAPGAGNTWAATFRHPSWSSFFETATLTDEAIAADTLKIFVGGSPSNANTLGIAEGGTTIAAGSGAFVYAVQTRGQPGGAGENPTDFGPWGGSIWFNSRIDWYFGMDVAGLPEGQSDFRTTATHELAHLLGFGEAPSWSAQIVSAGAQMRFLGPRAIALFGGPVPVDPVSAHWAEGTPGRVDDLWQETLMDPSTPRGRRELLTDLDRAGLADIGWQVSAIPEPARAMQTLVGLVLLVAMSRTVRGRSSLSRGCAKSMTRPHGRCR